jgi:Na+-transporting methylmalonyl-CoA/oxaloacetate decarboxylase gamma subunit
MGNVSSHFVGVSGGILMSIIAFSIVFLVVIGLMLLMMALKYFVGKVQTEDGKTPGGKTPVPAERPETNLPQATLAVAAPAAAGTLSADADGELVAVITAAITSMTGTAARVLSFAPSQPDETKARQKTPVWRMTSILLNSRGLRD